MAEFTAVFVEENNGSVDIKEEDVSVDIKDEDGSVDIKEECEEEEDPLSTTSQSTKGEKSVREDVVYIITPNPLKKLFFS